MQVFCFYQLRFFQCCKALTCFINELRVVSTALVNIEADNIYIFIAGITFQVFRFTAKAVGIESIQQVVHIFTSRRYVSVKR